MVEHFNQEDFERLKHEVETLVGRTIMSPKDFEFLTCQILGYTKESISISTLKRMWGYVASSCKPSAYNLNLLSRMVGYPDWESFVAGKNAISSSRFFVKSKLVAEALNLGEQVKVNWHPGRVIVVEYCGDDRFEVMESVNSKLSVGDTFVCHQFVADEPLYLSNLHHPGIPLCNYVAGAILLPSVVLSQWTFGIEANFFHGLMTKPVKVKQMLQNCRNSGPQTPE